MDQEAKTLGDRISADFDLIAQKLSGILQRERDRLVGLAENLNKNGPTAIGYKRTDEFLRLLALLREVDIGKFEILSTKKEESGEEKRRQSNGRRRKRDGHFFEEIELITGKNVVSAFGIQKPYGIVSVPDENCFAVKHDDHISLISVYGEMFASSLIVNSQKDHLPRPLLLNPLGKQLICVDGQNVKTLQLDRLQSSKNCGILLAELKERIKLTAISPLNIALSPSNQNIFVSHDHYISSYSLSDWTLIEKWRMNSSDVVNGPFILGARSDLLFYKNNSHNCTELFGVPIDENDKLDLGNQHLIVDGFRDLCAVTFTRDGSIFTVDPTRGCIEIFSPDGEEKLAKIRPPPEFDTTSEPFKPVSIAMLEAPSDGSKHFLFANGELRYSHVIATLDYTTNRMLFFGATSD